MRRRRTWIMALLVLLMAAGAGAQPTLGQGGGLWSSGPNLLRTAAGWTLPGSLPLMIPAGTAAQGSLCFTDEPTTCLYRPAAGQVGVSILGVQKWVFAGNFLYAPTSGAYISIGGGIFYGSANRWEQRNGDAAQTQALYAGYGGYWEHGAAQELVTIAAAASTDTTANLLPAGAIIDSVSVRVVTAIPTAATFTVGDATTAARFATGVSTAANTTALGLDHRQPDVSAAAGPVQAAAAKVRLTPNASPAAATGTVRVQVYYSKWIVPST
jgi:hypothetical protein